MNDGSTRFLKFTLLLIGLPVLAACIFIVPSLASLIPHQIPATELLRGLFLIGIAGSAVLFYLALYQAYVLLTLIDQVKAFSEISTRALRRIKFDALAISAIYLLETPVLYVMAEADDAPGLIVLGLIIAFASLVVAVFAAVLQRLLQDAMILKSENDLTV